MADAFQKSHQPYNSYLIDQELYVGVTQILNIEGAGDFLTQWLLKTFGGEPDPIAAHKAYMERVSGTGTAIHKYIELDLQGQEALAKNYARDDTIAAIEAYHDWKSHHKIKVVALEKVVSNIGWRCAGTLDALLEINDDLYILDWKTGAYKARYFTQLMAYKAMLVSEPKRKRIPGIEKAKPAVLEILRDGSPAKLITLESKYHGMITENDELGVFHALRYVWFMRNLKSKQWQPVIKNMEQLMDPMNQDFQKTFQLKSA